jgi:hypothetical protein
MMLFLAAVCCVLLSTVNGFRLFRSHAKPFSISMVSGDPVEYGTYLRKDKPVFIAGGSSGVGFEVVKKLSALGVPTKVLVRWPDAQAMLNALDHVTAVLGDALDEAAVQNCMNGCVAAITTLGGQPSDDTGIRVDYVGNSNVVEQAGILGVERIILVTSVGCGSTIGAISKEVYRALETALEAKGKAERDLKTYTNLDWTIIRPGGLKSEESTGSAVVTEDIMASGSITREDCASLIVQVLASKSCTRRELTAVDPSQETKAESVHYVPFKV